MRWLLLLPLAFLACSDPTGPAVLEPGTFRLELTGHVSGTVTGSAWLVDASGMGFPAGFIELRANRGENPRGFLFWGMTMPGGRPRVGELGVLSATPDIAAGVRQGIFAVAYVGDEGDGATSYPAVRGVLDIRESDDQSIVGTLRIVVSNVGNVRSQKRDLTLTGEFHALVREFDIIPD